uniref:RraA family protein n=1 Tax=Roseihalotalea indica TaxID=2867963 RepID=A0AA49JF12_9BACT|nr:RraA family protein [Tunicatimonas sp. TK19036]
MKLLCTFLLLLSFIHIQAQDSSNLTNEQLIGLYEGLRVADVSDGMDMVGLKDLGLMDPKIAPLWKDIDEFSHQLVGIAFTVRYVPTQRQRNLGEVARGDYTQWRDQWYTNISGEPFIEDLKPGDVIVIDNADDGDTGSVGSNNSMIWKKQGAVGIISAGGVRDTDEIIKQEIPVYMDYFKRGRGIRPGRNELESYNEPVVVGGVYIQPGDVIVADGDGVVVVPREHAVKVADAAREEKNIDMAARRQLYEELGIPMDFTVQDQEK